MALSTIGMDSSSGRFRMQSTNVRSLVVTMPSMCSGARSLQWGSTSFRAPTLIRRSRATVISGLLGSVFCGHP